MILFVDDERRHSDSYIRELNKKYQVIFHKDVDRAWQCFEKDTDEIELLILDIMMPPGDTFRKVDTDEGRRTGISFYEKIRKRTPRLPVIVLTNVADEEVEHRFRVEENCWYFQKEHYLPYELLKEVEQILNPTEINMEVH